MKSVTVNEAREALSRITGATPVGLSAFLAVEPKGECHLYGIAKLVRASVFTGADWQNTVNRQLAREGKEETFTASPRKWGKRVSAALVEHKGKWFLPSHVQRASTVFLIKEHAGAPWRPVAKEAIAQWLPESKPAPVGTEKSLFYRDWSLSNLTRLAFGGQVLRIR